MKNKKSGKYLGVSASATTEGAAVEQRASSTGAQQIWLITPSS